MTLVRCCGASDVEIPGEANTLQGTLCVPEPVVGVVVFAHGSGSGRHSPRNGFVADVLYHAGLGTLLLDLLTSDEGGVRVNVFDIVLLAGRVTGPAEIEATSSVRWFWHGVRGGAWCCGAVGSWESPALVEH